MVVFRNVSCRPQIQDRMASTGTLYLIPSPLGENALGPLPEATLTVARRLRHFVLETGKVGRRHLKEMQIDTPLPSCTFFELNKRTRPDELPAFLAPALEAGEDVGLLSDAGAPGVADPGAKLVRLAHRLGVRVIPLTGPSSILLGLMASGLDGQRFRFHGYLPPKKNALAQTLRRLERESRQQRQTELFIEAPYRNEAIFTTALEILAPNTDFCVARELTTPREWVATHSIEQWRQQEPPALHKLPTLFLLLAQ